jgi:hypothetical protein
MLRAMLPRIRVRARVAAAAALVGTFVLLGPRGAAAT